MEVEFLWRIAQGKSKYKLQATSSSNGQARARETGIRELNGGLNFSHLPTVGCYCMIQRGEEGDVDRDKYVWSS
jgi:hypothetical protein